MIEEIKITSLSGRGSVTMRTKDATGYWLDRQGVDFGQVEGKHQTYTYYNQIGSSIVSTSVQTRPLSIAGWVMDADGKLQERCDFLNAYISPVEDYILEYNGRKIQFRPDRSIIYSSSRKKNNEVLRRFLIQATCPYPLFSDSEDTASNFDKSGKRFVFPTSWGQDDPIIFAVTEKAYNKEIVNSGGMKTGIVAEITFSGEVSNPRIKNLTTGEYIGVTYTFNSGERLRMSTVPGSKYIRMYTETGEEIDLIRYRDYQMTWIQLETGANLLAIDCDDLTQRNNMAVTVYYTPLYLEVE